MLSRFSVAVVPVGRFVLSLLGLDLGVENGLTTAVHSGQTTGVGDLGGGRGLDEPVGVGLFVPPLPGGEDAARQDTQDGQALGGTAEPGPALLPADQPLDLLGETCPRNAASAATLRAVASSRTGPAAATACSIRGRE